MSRSDTTLCQSTVCRPASKGGPQQAQDVICWQCAERFPADLQSIAGMFADLDARIVSAGDYVITEKVHSSNDSHGIDLNDQVCEAKADLLKFTRWLVATVATMRPTVVIPEGQGTPDTLRWVARWHPLVFTRDLDSENIIRAVSVAHRSRSNVHRNAYPSGARRINIPGDCAQQAEDGGVCGGELYGIIRPGDAALPSAIICSADARHSIPSSEWVKLGRQLRKVAA